MAALSVAQFLVAVVPLKWWRGTLGLAMHSAEPARLADAERLAAHIDWAARRLGGGAKCLPRAMALSWLLRRSGLPHAVVFAVRPPDLRGRDDDLHAWVEVAGRTLIGNLPGPWVETLHLPEG